MNQARVRAVTTIAIEAQPNVLWVLVETDDGAVGLGETFFGADAVAAYIHETAAPYLIGSRYRQRELLAARAVSIALTDPTWCGGVTEAQRIGELAAAYSLPFGLHDCVGPVNLAVGVHLSVSVENVFMQEVVRAYLGGWYREVAVGVPEVVAGRISPSAAPGHGVRLAEDIAERPDAPRRRRAWPTRSGRAWSPTRSSSRSDASVRRPRRSCGPRSRPSTRARSVMTWSNTWPRTCASTGSSTSSPAPRCWRRHEPPSRARSVSSSAWPGRSITLTCTRLPMST